MEEIEHKTVRLGALLSYAILLGPLLGQYASFVPGISLGELLLIVSTILILLYNKGYRVKLNRVKPLLLLYFFGTTISLFSFLLQQQLSLLVITRMIRFSFYLFLVILCSCNLNKLVILKAYKKLCIVISAYIILQFIIFNIFGVLLPFKLLPFPWMDGRIYGVEEATHWATIFYLRPSGFFLEPAYAAQFLLPGLLFSLYGWSINKPQKINLLSFFLVLTALLLTNSSTGILISLIIIFMYFAQLVKKNKKYVDVIKNAFIVIFVIAIFLFFTQSELFNRTVRYVIGNISGGGSTALRVFRGFAVFLELPMLFKFIGVGHGNLGQYVINNGITTNYDSVSDTLIAADYTNAISISLLYYGILGFILYLNLFKNLLINTKHQFKLLVIVLFVLSFVSSIFFNVNMLLYMCLIYIGYETKY